MQYVTQNFTCAKVHMCNKEILVEWCVSLMQPLAQCNGNITYRSDEEKEI